EAMLPPEWDAQQVYDDHEVLMLHGQRCCFFRQPACHRCVLLDLCPTGQERRGKVDEAVGGREGFQGLPG
ncbi:Fe-S cluster assembly protein HesB, partial [Roseomonas sp. DSM 102946]|nr:Fe-S cluster assembly protein HesB [Roseomonas sp. DSM 102946]